MAQRDDRATALFWCVGNRKGFLVVAETSASDLIEAYSLTYGKDILDGHFPTVIDGLKRVHRRAVWCALPIVGKIVRSQTLINDVRDLHFHGDQSVYDTLLRMGATFEYNPALFRFTSDKSGYATDKQPASRYTTLTPSDIMYDLFYKNIEVSSLRKVQSDDLATYEPKYFVPALPTTLLYANNTIGFGFTSITLPLAFANVCDLVSAYAEHHTNHPLVPFDHVKHADKFVPDTPVENNLTNYNELVAAYKQGNFKQKVFLEGTARLSPDMIEIYTVPYMDSFPKAVEVLQSAMLTKNSWFDRSLHSVDSIGNENARGNLTVMLKRGVNVFEAWEKISRLISFAHGIVTYPNYSFDGFISELSPINLIRKWFQQRHDIILSSKKYKLASLMEGISQVEALMVACDKQNLDDILAIMRAHYHKDQGVPVLCEKYPLTPNQAYYLYTVRLEILTGAAMDDLKKKHQRLQAEVTELQASFSRIPQEISETAQALKKKYGVTRRAKIPKYIGYVSVGDDGCVQFEEVSELKDILNTFQKERIGIHMYDGAHLFKVNPEGKADTKYIPKYTRGDIYGIRTDEVYTVNIADGAACCVKGFVPGRRSAGFFYTTRQSKAIWRDGTIKTIDVTQELSMRKTICRGAASGILHIYPDNKRDHLVAIFNTDTPNRVTLQRVSADASKLVVNPQGDVEFVHSYTFKDVILNVDPKFLSRNTTRAIHVVDAAAILGDQRQVHIDLNASKWKSNKHLKLF